jgi:protein TonB
MLEALSASAAAPRLTPGRFLLSATFHGMILYAAIRPPLPAAEPTRARDVVLPPWEPRPETQHRDHEPVGGAAVIAPGPRGGFAAPAPDIPTGVPPVSTGPLLDRSALERIVAQGLGTAAGNDSATYQRTLLAGEVDEPAQAIRQPAPRYPPVLQQSGIEGKVLLEFIIDSTGHVEPASVRVLERSRAGFDAAALEAVEKSLFKPARVRGRPIRQRTLQSVVFRIG